MASWSYRARAIPISHFEKRVITVAEGGGFKTKKGVQLTKDLSALGITSRFYKSGRVEKTHMRTTHDFYMAHWQSDSEVRRGESMKLCSKLCQELRDSTSRGFGDRSPKKLPDVVIGARFTVTKSCQDI